jgi:hypothetical protein
MANHELTVLSLGAGQQSTYLMHLAHHDAAFRERFIGRTYVVAIAATLSEKPATNEHIERLRTIAAARGVLFFYLTPDLGFHTGNWRLGVNGARAATSTIGSVAFPSTCSVSTKIAPFYKWLASFVAERYATRHRDYRALLEFAERYGKIRVQLGFSAEETHRFSSVPDAQTAFAFSGLPDKAKDPLYRIASVEKVYPLAELGLTREVCVAGLERLGEFVPDASMCDSCHWKSPEQMLAMSVLRPDSWSAWVEAEERKLTAWADDDFRRARQKQFTPAAQFKNHGVAGRGRFVDGRWQAVTLRDTLADAQRRFAHLTRADLELIDRTHGGVGTAY